MIGNILFCVVVILVLLMFLPFLLIGVKISVDIIRDIWRGY